MLSLLEFSILVQCQPSKIVVSHIVCIVGRGVYNVCIHGAKRCSIRWVPLLCVEHNACFPVLVLGVKLGSR